jgi:hypothetical protein
MARDRRGRFTATRTTETTRVTERITAEYDDTLYPLPTATVATTGVLGVAPGWDDGPTDRHLYLAQRAGQVDRCLDFLTVWAVSAAPGAPVPPRLIGDATVILRAGPGATVSELELGRTV